LTRVRLIPTNIQGQPCGEHSHCARYPDSMVAEAKELRAQGLTMRAIAERLGPHFTTVIRWLNGSMRKPPARVIARRVRSK
jgi:hypothetical protein